EDAGDCDASEITDRKTPNADKHDVSENAGPTKLTPQRSVRCKTPFLIGQRVPAPAEEVSNAFSLSLGIAEPDPRVGAINRREKLKATIGNGPTVPIGHRIHDRIWGTVKSDIS